MRHNITLLAMTLMFALWGTTALAQYNEAARVSAPTESVDVTAKDDLGRIVTKKVDRKVRADDFGNAAGNQYDLAVDGAFEGQTITVLQFYTGGGFDFVLPKEALAQKGFSVYRWSDAAPTPKDLADVA